jgi:hypothetical protein
MEPRNAWGKRFIDHIESFSFESQDSLRVDFDVFRMHHRYIGDYHTTLNHTYKQLSTHINQLTDNNSRQYSYSVF